MLGLPPVLAGSQGGGGSPRMLGFPPARADIVSVPTGREDVVLSYETVTQMEGESGGGVGAGFGGPVFPPQGSGLPY